jgi:Kef-type K+ transport system membrane component KefB
MMQGSDFDNKQPTPELPGNSKFIRASAMTTIVVEALGKITRGPFSNVLFIGIIFVFALFFFFQTATSGDATDLDERQHRQNLQILIIIFVFVLMLVTLGTYLILLLFRRSVKQTYDKAYNAFNTNQEIQDETA